MPLRPRTTLTNAPFTATSCMVWWIASAVACRVLTRRYARNAAERRRPVSWPMLSATPVQASVAVLDVVKPVAADLIVRQTIATHTRGIGAVATVLRVSQLRRVGRSSGG